MKALTKIMFLLLIVVIGFSSCGRKITSHTRDTIYVKKTDTIHIKPDTVAILKVERSIDSVFVEIEKECPNLPKTKLVKLKEVVEAKCTHESLSGGTMKAKSAKTNANVIIHFNGNEATVYFDVDQPEITDTIEREVSFWYCLKETVYVWCPLLLFFIVWLIAKLK